MSTLRINLNTVQNLKFYKCYEKQNLEKEKNMKIENQYFI